MALPSYRVHRSLLRPPLLFGVERRLFFAFAIGAVPLLSFGDLSLRSTAALGLYLFVAHFAATRITARDNNLVEIWLQNLGYDDQYEPLPSPTVKGRGPKLPRKI